MGSLLFKVGSLGAGFVAGLVANNVWEANKWYGYGVKAIPLNGKAFGVDDLILIGLGLLLLVLGYFKFPLLSWFGAGWVLAQLVDKAME